MTFLRTLAGTAAALMLLAVPAAAQDNDDPDRFSEEKLLAFADAAIDVNLVMQEWRGKIAAAQSEEKAKAMMDDANAEISQAIKDAEGITVAEYDAIASAAQADEAFAQELNEAVRTRYEERQGEGQ